MSATDTMLARYQAELEERSAFADGLVDGAEAAGRDMTSEELELHTRTRDRMQQIVRQMEPLQDTARITAESRSRTAELVGMYQTAPGPQQAVEYRSAGAYIADLYYARMGDADAMRRQEVFHRVASHQTTADNPGLLPQQIVQPVVNFLEVARPIIGTLGPTDLGSGGWSYARVTQHTLVGKQSAEKTELPSRKMTVSITPLGADTFGGYVNVSKQNINRSSPAILDMVIADLAAQYGIETEEEAGTVLTAAATAGPAIPADPTSEDVNAAIWTAVGQVFAATKGQGTTVVAVAPNMLGLIGPLFPSVNPQNAVSPGFTAAGISNGANGSISGVTVIMSAGLADGTILVYSTAAAKAFEYVYGNMQVNEPSVWGVQVGYAGDFDAVVIEPAGVVKVTVTP